MADTGIQTLYLRFFNRSVTRHMYYTTHQRLCNLNSARHGQFQEKEKRLRLLNWKFSFRKLFNINLITTANSRLITPPPFSAGNCCPNAGGTSMDYFPLVQFFSKPKLFKRSNVSHSVLTITDATNLRFLRVFTFCSGRCVPSLFFPNFVLQYFKANSQVEAIIWTSE